MEMSVQVSPWRSPWNTTEVLYSQVQSVTCCRTAKAGMSRIQFRECLDSYRTWSHISAPAYLVRGLLLMAHGACAASPCKEATHHQFAGLKDISGRVCVACGWRWGLPCPWQCWALLSSSLNETEVENCHPPSSDLDQKKSPGFWHCLEAFSFVGCSFYRSRCNLNSINWHFAELLNVAWVKGREKIGEKLQKFGKRQSVTIKEMKESLCHLGQMASFS